jgi:single-strand DNA-binding protein
MYINKAIIYGNLTRDPEIKALASGVKVCSFGVATNRIWKDKEGAKKEGVDFHNVVVFGRTAELVAQYLRKGSAAFIEGRMQTRSWDGADGQKKYRTEIVADSIQFGPKSGGSNGSYQSADSSQKATPSATPATEKDSMPVDTIDYPEEEINPDDIPF